MYIVSTYSEAVLLSIVTMLAWGSWANMQKLTGNWRFELFYWDFVAGILIFATIMGFTFGSTGTMGRAFLADIFQADSSNIISAIIGGFIWNLANLLLVAAISLAGLAMAFSIGTGIGWIMGILINYYFAPIGNPVLLFSGTAAIAIAILFSMAAYKKLPTAIDAKGAKKGIIAAVLGGLLICWYYRFVASSVVSDFTFPEVGKLTPYTAVFFFAVGVFVSSFLFNSILMRNPVQGVSLTVTDFIKSPSRNHIIGIIGGLIWCIALSLSFLSSEKAGFAVSYGLGNGATMIGIAWGVFIWKEFKSAPKGTNILLALMFSFYLLGLALIVYSRI